MVFNACLSLTLFFLLTGLASSTFISYAILGSHGSTSRTLLQAKAACSVDFEIQNYTIITSQCKGPPYSPKPCCEGFKQFACPFTDQINDGKSNCASTMFSYIHVYGRYPPGLFASLCKEGMEGLSCKDTGNASTKNSDKKSGHHALLDCTQFPEICDIYRNMIPEE
ncbi:GPI-anchored protein LLG3-like [Cornus florida]|uniref:GPI-anchored protein LLG3-like n=1 Tax=Cornus florida TaxID=4283 RepID=UPI00289DB31E|nr:GPI-anchored protein LLG3-like [Cornus florida]